MPSFGKGKIKYGKDDCLRTLDGVGRGAKVVRDAGEAGLRYSWRTLEEAWARTGVIARANISSSCIEIPGVEVSIRVPSIKGDSSQLRCPASPKERCGTCIVDAAFNMPDFPLESISDFFVTACGRTV